MGTRIYVGNLPYSVDETQLRALFAEKGRAVREVNVVLEPATHRPRGFAFVEMGTESEARAAIDALHGKVLGGRALTVNPARERERAGRRSGGGGGGGGGVPRGGGDRH